MYAVVETGGKQYKVEKNDVFLVEKLLCKEGEEVKLDKVLLAKDGAHIHVGAPYLAGAQVICTAMGDLRQPKVVAFKFKRRKSEKKKIGHRQTATQLKVKEISLAKG